MKSPVFLLRKAIRWWRDMPEFQLLMSGFGLSLVWEVLQSPFYTDTFERPWTTLLYNRLHCAGGDALLLLVSFWLVALGWGRRWIHAASGVGHDHLHPHVVEVRFLGFLPIPHSGGHHGFEEIPL